MPNINELLTQHVTLEVDCLDRLYLNGYIPQMQTAGHLVNFLVHHRGQRIPSPALLGKMTQGFKTSVETFAAEEGLVIVPFERDDRKDDVSAQHRQGLADSYEGVYLLGVAQEKASAFRGVKDTEKASPYVSFQYDRRTVCVNHYYFYLLDEDFGPAFIKVGTYAPFPLKVCLNGHEWVKRQLKKERIGFQALDNGFRTCERPDRLHAISDTLGPVHIEAFFRKWLDRLPLPLTAEDRAAGYDWRLSIWQVEVSRTQVFAQPLRGRQFFEEVIRENVDLGRPDRVQLVFDRRITKATPGRFRTRVIHEGVHPSLHIEYKKCHVKQYFKENRALRTETTINEPKDFKVGKDLSNLKVLQGIGRSINRRLLDVQRVSQHCTLSQETIEAVTQPTLTPEGQRAAGLRFGDPRVMTLFAALTLFCHVPCGFSNNSLRPCVAALLGPDVLYRANQMTYDLRRLCRKGIIQRRAGTNRYYLTPYGRKVALFFTKLETRVFRPAFASFAPEDDLPRPLTLALRKVDSAINDILDEAQLDLAA